jgi:hypothetical protein
MLTNSPPGMANPQGWEENKMARNDGLRLARGIENVDLARKRIRNVVEFVVSLLHDRVTDRQSIRPALHLPSNSGWKIRVLECGYLVDVYFGEVQLITSTPGTSIKKYYYAAPGVFHVLDIYYKLNDFLDLAREMFPFIEADLAPFIQAGKVEI